MARESAKPIQNRKSRLASSTTDTDNRYYTSIRNMNTNVSFSNRFFSTMGFSKLLPGGQIPDYTGYLATENKNRINTEDENNILT